MADKENDTSNSTKIGISSDSEIIEKRQKESATGAIRKMFDDTRTRKAVRNEIIGSTSVKKLSPMDDPMNVRNTDTGNLKRMMENTKTRKTVKLKPLSGQKPVQLTDEPVKPSARQTIKLKSVDAKPNEAQAKELAKIHDAAIATANARKTVKLKAVAPAKVVASTSTLPKESEAKIPKATIVTSKATANIPANTSTLAKASEVAEAGMTSASATAKIGDKSDTSTPTDPLKKRDSNTGTMKKLPDDTKTRKTVKLTKAGVNANQPAETVVASADGSTLAQASAVVEAGSAGDTTKIGDKSDASTPADPLKKRDTNTGTMKKMLDDTKTRKTVKLKKSGVKVDQQAATVVESADAVTDEQARTSLGKPRSSQTQKFKARQTQNIKGRAKRRRAVPGAKETIKLRPSAGKAAPTSAKANAQKQTIRMAPVKATEASDTIKLSKKPKDPNKRPIPAKTAGVQKADSATPKAKLVGIKSAKVVGSEILATDTAKASAGGAGVQKAKVIQPANFATDTAHTISLEEGSKKSGLSLPKRPLMPPKRSGAPTAPTQKLSIPEDNEVEMPKRALKVKQTEAPAGAGAPIAQKGEAEFGSGKKKKAKKAGTGEASISYTVLAVASLILLGAASFISAAQYINLWEQQRIGKHISIPLINDFISKIDK